MKNLGEIIKELRGNASLREAAERIGISHTYLDTIEKGYDKRSGSPIKPTPETLRLLSKAYDYSYENLMQVAGYIEVKQDIDEDNWDSRLPELTAKDERDITVDLEKMINNLDSKDGYAAFDGNSMDEMEEEDREILKASLENSLRLAKRMAKQKFTPKKYRD